ncbi:hypothetical protein [Phreatobacter sp.]|uniref:hypothetical protein n=1 Tax=Phreatobacter sp. TaxID=1966341 RepID=UPI003F70993F
MKSVPAALLAAVAISFLAGCGTFQSQAPSEPPPPPPANAPPPPLPPDPALGPHGQPQEETSRRGRRPAEPQRSTW